MEEAYEKLPEELGYGAFTGSTFDRYKCGKMIGEGAFGKVFLGEDLKTKDIVALKLINKEAIQKLPNQQQREYLTRLIETECRNLLKCQSEYIVRCYGIYSNKKIQVIVMEYCKDGTLADFLFARKAGFDQGETIPIFKQLIMGISAIHKNGIIHRDIKPHNILVHDGKFKIADLGMSKVQQSQLRGTCVGTIFATAPEILARRPYGPKVDIWSLGVILYRFVFNKYPYPLNVASFDEMFLVISIRKVSYNEQGRNPSPQMIDLLQKMLEVDPQKRYNYKQIAEHPLFNRKMQNLPQSYVDEPDFSNLENQEEELSKKQNEANQELYHQLFKETRELHFNALKAEAIYKQIILQLDALKIFPKMGRDEIEFMYLLAQRCFLYVTVSMEKTKTNLLLAALLLKPEMVELMDKIKKYFRNISEQLTKQENKFMSIVKDRIAKSFQNDTYELKEQIFNGIQDIDYTRQTQVKLTQILIQGYFIKFVEQRVARDPLNPKLLRLFACLHIYGPLNQVSCEQTYKNGSTFEVEKNNLVKPEQSSILL